ncbi:NACHT domain-containing protein [Limnospira sp. PMC 1245.20]|uniref:WD40 domain-containing protein n=1 Tax=Limnospira sp. PMC 1245.20 TaxID=2981043 RepID=UPI0028E0A946|nr:NACHT domain-containing protein [Limnospira sp. PMC 1245.20]MDT9193453.1 NACHT domain-containing protein [Limnospira sp. PMC 1245.20]
MSEPTNHQNTGSQGNQGQQGNVAGVNYGVQNTYIGGTTQQRQIDRDICRRMLDRQVQLSSNTVIGQVYGDRNLIDEDLFVDLALVKPKRSENPKHPQEIDPEKGSDLYNREEVEKRFAYREFLQEVISQRTEKRLAIIGEPGAGKTTLLQKLAFWLLQETDDLVVWVSLAELGSQPLGEYLEQKWLTEALRQSREEIKADWGNKFEGGAVWLLLDGLDEMSQTDQQALKLRGWVTDARMIVTCRLNLWQANPSQLQGFQTYLTQPFQDEQMQEFIRRWFRGLVAEGEDVQLAESLWSELQESGKERIKDLCRNPLRLTLLASRWKGRKGDSLDTIVKRLGWLSDGEVDVKKPQPRDYPSSRGEVSRHSWGNAPDISVFFGRTEELKTLEKWIVADKCRLVAIVGIGGIGKTRLPVKLGKGGIGKTDLSLTLVREITEEFDYIMWQDLKNAPPVEDTFQQIIKFLSSHKEIDLPDENKLRIDRILEYLRQNRCLIILDNIESILNQGKSAGQYCKGYEAYGELFLKIAETDHNSCLLLTSREKPKNISRIEGKNKPVRFFELTGVNYEDGRRIVENVGNGNFYGSNHDWEELIALFNGNPLALELTANYIQETFDGKIADFLQDKNHISGSPLEEGQNERDDMRKLLDWHFQRLSDSEQEIVYWLAINRVPMSLNDLKKDILLYESRKIVGSTFQSIRQRFLLEKIGEKFTLQPVILEYVTDLFVNQVYKEIINITVNNFINKYSFIKSLADEYIMEDQIRLILNSINIKLKQKVDWPAGMNLEKTLNIILEEIHKSLKGTPGYATGNLINLLWSLKIDISNYNFSGLVIRQAYLQKHSLKGVDFSYCDLSDSCLSEDFGTIPSLDLVGGLVAAGTTSGAIHLWEIETEQRILTLPGHDDWVWGIALSLDGLYLASCGGDKIVKLWNVKNGDCTHIWTEHNSRVRGLAFSPKGDLVASGDEEGEIKLWDVKSGQSTKRFRLKRAVWANTIAFSPDGNLLAVGSQNCLLKVWNVNSGEEIKKIKDYHDPIRSISFSPDGNLIAISGDSSEIWILNIKTWNCQQKISGYKGWIRDISFSFDSKKLASCGADKIMRIWNIETGQCIQSMQGHSKPVRAIAFQGDKVLSASEDQTLRFWDSQSGKCLRLIQGYTNPVWSVACSPTQPLIVSGDEDCFVRVWDLSTLETENLTNKVLGNHDNLVRAVAFNCDGSLLASGSYDGTVKIWEITNYDSIKFPPIKKGFDEPRDRVISVAFHPIEPIIAISYYYGEKVNIWNFKTRQIVQKLPITNSKGDKVRPRDVAFSPDGCVLAISSDSREEPYIRLWDIQNKKYLKPLEGHQGAVWSLDFNLDGQTLASCDGNGSIRLWNIQSYDSIQLEGHSVRVRAIKFSPNGQKLVSGSDDKTVKIWDVQSRQCIATLEGHQSWIWSVAFSHDSEMVVSSSDDNTVKIWSVRTGKCLSTLRPDRPYEGMNITGVIGLKDAQKAMLKNLGAFEK